MRYNPARQEVVLKVVYYGPGLAGKTTNLQALRQRIPAGRASELVSVDTHSERTLQFDFLALELGKVQGQDLRLDFYTVPGQSYYAATRRQVLAGADGVVFVADSRREALDENIDAMNEMLGNLRHHGLPDDLPLVVQYNKQDLPTSVPPEQLQPLLNVRGWPSFAAAAINGDGVAETCEALARLMADRLEETELPVVLSAAAASPPAPSAVLPAPEPPRSWLITCHRCQSMLDVPSAGIGEVYTCGVCQSQLEIVDPDHGSTRLPHNAPRPITGQHQRSAARQGELDPYLADDIGPVGQALHPAGAAARPELPADSGFPLDGFTVLALLDNNVQGRRMRVRENASGRTFRALTLSRAFLAQPGYRDTVEPYTRMTGPIRHPNILHLVSFRQLPDPDGPLVFLSADPQDHESLSHVLARRRALAPPHAIGILRQITLALEEAARHGAIHGWLRPDAVLISAEGGVLVDELCIPPNHRFLLRELAGASAATEYYLPPEYLNDDLRGDVRADIFLLGALLFRMVTGEGLVTGYNALEALHRLTANGPRMLRDAQQGVSRELNNFYLKLVAVDRSQRFQTYHEVIDALDRFGGGAKRQTIQLTAGQNRGPGAPVPLRQPPGTPGAMRRSGTGPIQPPVRRSPVREPSGGQPILPPRRKASSSAPLIITALVVVILVAIVAVVVSSLPRGQFANQSTVEPATVPAMTPRPPATVVVAPVVTPVPPREAPAVRPAPTDPAQERLALRRRLADQLVANEYADALVTAARFADAGERQAAEANVLQHHDAHKQEIEGQLRPGLDPLALRAALEPFRGVQRLTGDLDWAMAVQSKADVIALQEPAPAPGEVTAVVNPAPADQATVSVPGIGEIGPNRPAPLFPGTGQAGTLPPAAPAAAKTEAGAQDAHPLVDPAVNAYGSVLRALQANQLAQAQTAIVTQGLDPVVVTGLTLLTGWWPKRAEFINRVAGTKAVARLRFTHPSTGEVVDVTAAEAAGVNVSSPTGGSSVLAWGQIPPATMAKLFADASLAANITADEVGAAIVSELVADDLVQATLIARRGKAVLGEKQVPVQQLIELHGRRAMVTVLNKGFDAVRNRDQKLAADALAEIRRFDKAQLKPVEAEIERLAGLAIARAGAAIPAPPGGTAPAPAPAPGDGAQAPKDLKERQAVLATLGWRPLGNAWVEGTEVRIPGGSGIAFTTAKAFARIAIEVRGDGYLTLVPSRGQAPVAGRNGLSVPILKDAMTPYTVVFSGDSMSIVNGRGETIQTTPITAPPTTIQISTTADATLATIPTISFQ